MNNKTIITFGLLSLVSLGLVLIFTEGVKWIQ